MGAPCSRASVQTSHCSTLSSPLPGHSFHTFISLGMKSYSNHSCLLLVTRAMRCAIGAVPAEQWPLWDSDVAFKGNKNTACPLRLTLCKILFHRVFLTCCKQKANSENQAVHIFIEIRVAMCLVFRCTFVLAKQGRQHL